MNIYTKSDDKSNVEIYSPIQRNRFAKGSLHRVLGVSPQKALALAAILFFTSVCRSHGEDRVDTKSFFYQEGDDRIRVVSPTFLFEKDLSSTLHLKIEGVYNKISGASPTGAPPKHLLLFKHPPLHNKI
ncbi:MAG: DUF3570 domain-containing protein [Kiritimatiellae bacterium]|nr:DUF3570 domain-containing protein [Kiritimatiellia bacterium]